ncbi:MAG: hypothetical protein Q9184_006127, partial [Pyrenodesmia sp. 2 TL-2023]
PLRREQSAPTITFQCAAGAATPTFVTVVLLDEEWVVEISQQRLHCQVQRRIRRRRDNDTPFTQSNAPVRVKKARHGPPTQYNSSSPQRRQSHKGSSPGESGVGSVGRPKVRVLAVHAVDRLVGKVHGQPSGNPAMSQLTVANQLKVASHPS